MRKRRIFDVTAWLFVIMPYTEEGKILINNLFDLKCYNDKHLLREFSSK